MTVKQLQAALVLAEEKEQLEQRIAELDSEMEAALNGQVPRPVTPRQAAGDLPVWVKGPLDRKVFGFLQNKESAGIEDMAKACKTTRFNISNWLARRRKYLVNPSRGQWAIRYSGFDAK